MLTLIQNDRKFIEIEKEIMNSNKEYNAIAYDKQILDKEDILATFKEADEWRIERYLVKKDEDYIAILDYGMSSPRHQKPWLSLLAIHQKYQGLGWTYPCQVDRFKKTKQPSDVDILSVSGG
ncbi:hypothetical protein MHB44_02195 [Lysinibacillus sp. FSL H8-0500]|uniref:hypothetical protein n=1 Tax=Lysinibacillus sp. FSL H8-0500 TaxID=2921393 RepID=UPI0031013586